MEERYGRDGGRVGGAVYIQVLWNATPFSSQNNPTHNTASRMANQVTVRYSCDG